MYDYQYLNDLIQFGTNTRTLVVTLDGVEVWRNDCDFKTTDTNDTMNNYADGIINMLRTQAGG